MKERTDNPHPEIVERTCNSCVLLPSKPGTQKTMQHILAACDSASRLKKLVDGKLVQLVYTDPDDLGAKRVAAYFGYLAAEASSDKNRFKKPNDTNQNKIKFSKSDGF